MRHKAHALVAQTTAALCAGSMSISTLYMSCSSTMNDSRKTRIWTGPAGQLDRSTLKRPKPMTIPHFAARFVVLFALVSSPILANQYLPLYDYPNHLARMYLLRMLPVSPGLQHYYAINWRALPNLAMDLVVPILSRLVPLAFAGKLFILLTLFLLAAGPALFHRILFREWSDVPLLSFLVLYSRILLWGYLNFLFGLGLALVLFAAWLALRSRRPLLRLFVGTIFVIVLYFAHLEAVGIYGLMVLSYEMAMVCRRQGVIRERLVDLSVVTLPFLVPIAFLLLSTPAVVGTAVWFTPFRRKFDLVFTIFDAEDRIFDIGCFVIAVSALSFVLSRRWLSLAATMRVPLAALGIAYVVMPTHIFTAFGADHRLPLAFTLVLVGSLRWTERSERVQARFMAGAAALFVLRLSAILLSWHDSSRTYERLLPVLDQVPEGSRIAIATPGIGNHDTITPLDHFPTLAIIRNNAFVPTLFASPKQQPIVLTPAFRALADSLSQSQLWDYFVGDQGVLSWSALGCYNFVLFVAHYEFHVATRGALLFLGGDPEFQLYRVVPLPGQVTCAGSCPYHHRLVQ